MLNQDLVGKERPKELMALDQMDDNTEAELLALSMDTLAKKLIITVDFGVCTAVQGGNRHVAPGFWVMPKKKQKNGTYFLAASGTKLLNLGEKYPFRLQLRRIRQR